VNRGGGEIENFDRIKELKRGWYENRRLLIPLAVVKLQTKGCWSNILFVVMPNCSREPKKQDCSCPPRKCLLGLLLNVYLFQLRLLRVDNQGLSQSLAGGKTGFITGFIGWKAIVYDRV
jgi:hypothetical protein